MNADLLHTSRPFGMGFWPLAEDAPAVAPRREEVRIVVEDGGLVRGILWTPGSGASRRSAVLLAHPRGDFTVHYACPLLASAGFPVLGIATRYLNNDTDCLHEKCALDVAAAAAHLRHLGYEAVVLFGNSGGGSLTALAHVEHGCGDGWVGVAAHPGEGVFMENVIDPAVADESDPLSVVEALDMYNPANGWRPWPEPSSYDPAWLETYRAAQRARVARIDAVAHEALAVQQRNREAARKLDRGTEVWRHMRRRAVHTPYLTIYRTLADPAYLDPEIEPDDRPLGSLFAFPDPFDANYGMGGLARTMTPRGWLSTWSSISSRARLADTLPDVRVPSLVLHATADTEIRLSQARALRDASGSDDMTYHEVKGAPHYLEGHRPETMHLVSEWIAARFP
ncbi:MAG: alpha/beta hydrolase [Actinobacteria bacterium ATB1]|nr:alpha/beta hydrolase [Actinobacteria bacterium ATB1]